MEMNAILAATITTPHLHWPAWLSGFGGGIIVGMILMAVIVHSKRV
jgi:hypothetical protein